MHHDDDQPMVHEIGNRTYIVADVDPLDLDGVRTMQVGTALWAVALVLLLPFYGRLEDDGHLWWLWTCVAGFGLGLVGWDHCRRRRNARGRGGSRTSVTRPIYYTATTLDGYIADEHDSLAWLFEQDTDEGGPAGYERVHRRHRRDGDGRDDVRLDRRPHARPPTSPGPTTSRAGSSPTATSSRSARTSGSSRARSREHREAITAVGRRPRRLGGRRRRPGRSVRRRGLLDRMVLSIAPVTLGAGRPLFPRRHDLSWSSRGATATSWWRRTTCVGARSEAARTARSRRG